MTIAQKKSSFRLLKLIQSLTWNGRLKKCYKKVVYISFKCYNTPGDNETEFYEINLPYYGEGSPEEWLVGKDKLVKFLDGQGISTELHSYTFSERLLTSDEKATFNQTALDIGIRTVDNFNKVLAKMTKHAFPAYTFREQKRYLCRYLL